MEAPESTIVAQAARVAACLGTEDGRRTVQEMEREVQAFRQELDESVRIDASILSTRITR